MRLLATPLGYLLTWIYNFVGSYGIAIIIFTIIVKVALYPVYSKQMKSTMKMGETSAKVKEIQQKYGKDQALMNEKIQEYYKQEGVSMYSGCLPMVVQMIVIMGLFTLLRNPMAYLTSDSMLFAVHESFLWMKDLAQPDLWILPIAAGVVTFISYSMNSMNNMTGAGGNAATGQAMNAFMKFFFPVMILWFARSYPAGLSIYWFFSQVIQIFYNLKFNSEKKKMKEQEMVNEQRKRIDQKKKQQAKAN